MDKVSDKYIIVNEEKKLVRRRAVMPEERQWFAMSAPYSRELKAGAALDELHIESYVPMRYTLVRKGGIKKKLLLPVIHNLIFVFESRSRLNEVKKRIGYLQYRTTVKDGRSEPIVVPSEQMESFRKVCESANEKVQIVTPQHTPAIETGTRVRILGDEFQGVEGYFVKLSGRRGRSVIVVIPGVATAITATVSPDLIEVIE